jgi:hypothetical protein
MLRSFVGKFGGSGGALVVLIGALFAFGPLTAPLAAAAAWNWNRGRRAYAALCGMAIAAIWAIAYGFAPALLAFDAQALAHVVRRG